MNILLLLLGVVSALRSTRKDTCFYQQFKNLQTDVECLAQGTGSRSVEVRLQSPDVLYKMYTLTNGDEWTHSDGWGLNTLICAWYGITCDDYGQVIGIDLEGNNLGGDISEVPFHRLQYLTSLNLRNNNVGGALPTSVSDAASLEEVDLSYNGIGGGIPEHIGNLAALRVLRLRGNMLEGVPPPSLSQLGEIEEIDLSMNHLTGTLDWAYEFPKLQKLDVHQNRLSGGVGMDLGDTTTLQYLDISSNDFTGGFDAALGGLENLEYLNLRDCGFSGTLPAQFGNLAALKEADLSTPFNGQMPNTIGNLANLQKLVIEASFTGTFPETIKNLNQLTHLKIVSNIEGELPPSYSEMEAIQEIQISGQSQITGASGELPSEWAYFPRLTSMDLSNNMLGNGVPDEWTHLQDLTYLDLSSNMLKGTVEALRNLTESGSLDTLYLTNNNFYGDVPQWVYESTVSNLHLNGNLFECPVYNYCVGKHGDCDFNGNGTVSCVKRHVTVDDMFTVCEGGATIDQGTFYCQQPSIVYDLDGGKRGIPCPHDSENEAQDIDSWCHELGFAGVSGVTHRSTRMCEAPKGAVSWCSDYDANTPHWCDYGQGEWKNDPLTTHTCQNCYSSLRCGMQIRLVDEDDTGFSGRVEINRDGEWGTICNTGFTDVEASVVCMQLGFSGENMKAKTFRMSEMGTASGSIYLNNVQCTGDEINIGACTHSDWGDTGECTHDDDVGVVCAAATCTHTEIVYDLFDSFPLCFLDDDTKSNTIWDELTNLRYVPRFDANGVVIHDAYEDEYTNERTSLDSTYTGLVWCPDTRIAVFRDGNNLQDANDYLRIGTVYNDRITSFEINWADSDAPDNCFLLSASNDEFLCLSSVQPLKVQHWLTHRNSTALTYIKTVDLLESNGNPANYPTVKPTLGGTFGWDGRRYLIVQDGDAASTYNVRMMWFDSENDYKKVEVTYAPDGYWQSIYYDWGVCRYTTHTGTNQLTGDDNHEMVDRQGTNYQCYTPSFKSSTCGNRICEPGEDEILCPSDCGCGRATTEQLQTIDGNFPEVFSWYDQCYQTKENPEVAWIWDKYFNVIVGGSRNTANNWCGFHAEQDFECNRATGDTGLKHQAMVFCPGTRILVSQHNNQNQYAWSHTRVHTLVGTSIRDHGAIYSNINAPGECRLLSSTVSHFLCMYDNRRVRWFRTRRESREVDFEKEVAFRADVGNEAWVNSYDGRFAFDGHHYIIPVNSDHSANKGYKLFDDMGFYIGQYNTEQSWHGVYFSWSTCRYQMHSWHDYGENHVDAERIFYEDHTPDGQNEDYCFTREYPMGENTIAN